MSAVRRNLYDTIRKDLEKKFVFLTGPRRVGKTTLAEQIMKDVNGAYLLYDDDQDRRVILNRQYTDKPWVCLDEFHKFARWKSHIKGIYDKHHKTLHLLLTGSARLDVYQKSGDSLFGRYCLHHLHPFTYGELHSETIPGLSGLPEHLLEPHPPKGDIQALLRFSGFPEPFTAQSEQEYRRWRRMRHQLLVQEELRDLTRVQLLSLIEQLLMLLPEKIGSLFSYTSLSEDLRVSVPTVQNWMEILQRLFVVYKVTPYSRKISRSLVKQPKYFLYDWSEVVDEGGRFENLVAGHLWKAVQVWTGLGEANLSLHFVRDRDGREVDFLVARDRNPWFIVEAKMSESRVSDHLRVFSRRLNVPGIQLVLKSDLYKKEGNILVVSADRWLGYLP